MFNFVNSVNWVILHVFYRLLMFFSKSTFLKKTFRNIIRVSNSLDPDQARQFVVSYLGPNCLQKVLSKLVGKEKHSQLLAF